MRINCNSYILLLLIAFSFSACKTPNLFNNTKAIETQKSLSTLISQLDVSPDDPLIFDSLFKAEENYCPVLSNPLWIIPSEDLTSDVKIQKSNNNVTICILNRKLYMAFRTGPYHFASKKTGLYVISTQDFLTWKKEFELFNGRDAREPYLIAINDTLHFYFFTAGTKLTSFKPDRIKHYILSGEKWVQQDDILEAGEVQWEIKKRNDKVYLTTYKGEHYRLKGESEVRLNFKHTTNGFEFYPTDTTSIVYKGGVSECAFEFDKEGNLWAVTRNEDGDRNGFGSQLAFANKNNLQDWRFSSDIDPNCYMSPKMFRHNNELYLVGRKQLGKKPFGKAKRSLSMGSQRLKNWIGFSLTPKTTALYRINKQSMKIEWITDLPGNGDTAFPSIQRLNQHQFLIANYSSPVERRKKRSWLSGQFGRTGIYLCVLSFEECND